MGVQVMQATTDTVLDVLEAEAIHILREAAGAFRRPVLLYSIGKDSSVLLHLAGKAFAPGRIPFPVLHIDTGWKFREMIAFRDATASDLGLDLRVHTNEQGRSAGVTPFTHGTQEYTRVNKIRYVVEQVITNFKTWRIMHTDYRRPLSTFSPTISTVVALNFYLAG